MDRAREDRGAQGGTAGPPRAGCGSELRGASDMTSRGQGQRAGLWGEDGAWRACGPAVGQRREGSLCA